MKSYLLLWNPEKYEYDELPKFMDEIRSKGSVKDRWSTGNTKSIKEGDRVFFIKLATEPKGIIGYGVASSDSYEGIHWEDNNKKANYIDVNFYILEETPIIDEDTLKEIYPKNMFWTPLASGINIPDNIANTLEAILYEIDKYKPVFEKTDIYKERKRIKSECETWERNQNARQTCLDKYGYSCSVCGYNFEKVFGEIGRGCIEVHHLSPLSAIDKEHIVNPISDLRPICSNCHTMAHYKRPAHLPYSIEELKDIIKNNS